MNKLGCNMCGKEVSKCECWHKGLSVEQMIKVEEQIDSRVDERIEEIKELLKDTLVDIEMGREDYAHLDVRAEKIEEFLEKQKD